MSKLGTPFLAGAALALGLTWTTPGPAQAQTAVASSALRVFDVRASDRRHEAAVVTAVAISADGRWLAAGGDDHLVRIWNLADGELAGELKSHADWIRSIAFDPAGGHLASAGDDHAVLVWDAKALKIARKLPDAAQVIYSKIGRAHV